MSCSFFQRFLPAPIYNNVSHLPLHRRPSLLVVGASLVTVVAAAEVEVEVRRRAPWVLTASVGVHPR